MKAKRIVIVLVGLVLIILCLCFVPRIIVHRYWNKVEYYSKLEKYKSALDYALKAKHLSHWWHMKPACAKSLLYEIKCKNELNCTAEEIINLLRQEIQANASPVKEIVASMYIEKLWDRCIHNRRWSYNQTFLDKPDDISTWSNKTVIREIIANIHEIRKNTRLKNIPFSNYQNHICTFSDDQIELPTLYDFLMWHSIELLNWSNRYFYEDYIVHNPIESFFVPLDDFLKLKIADTDTFDLYTTSMGLYQDLLKFRKSNHDPRLMYEFELQRLNNLREQFQLENADEKYLEIIENYRKSVKNRNALLLLDYALMNEFKSQEKKNNFKKKCYEIIQSYPYRRAEVQECIKLWKDLSKKTLDVYAEDVYSNDKPLEIKIKSQNEDSVYCNLFKLSKPLDPAKNIEIKNDSAYKLITGNCIDKKLICFGNDFSQTKEKQISYNNLKTGIYLLSVGFKKNLNDYANVEKWQIIKISNLGSYYYNSGSETEIYAIKRKNGEPVKKASIVLYPDKKKKQEYLTDAMGKVKVNDSLLTGKLQIGFEGDTIVYDRIYRGYPDDEYEVAEHIQIFTDRAVYRPSQTIYFKGIFDRSNSAGKKYYPISNTKVLINFNHYGFNYGETVVTTNEFGSFSGSFEIPAKFPLGEMEISTDYGDHSVWVEEYKQTKMRLTVLPNKQPVSIGDSLIVTGYSKYLNGLPARNLPISFQVRQTIDSKWSRIGNSKFASGQIYSDNLGQFKIRIKTIPHSKDLHNQYGYEYLFSVKCKDEFGEIQSAYCSIPVGNNSCKAEIKIDECLIKQPVIKIPVEFTFNYNSVIPQKCQLMVYRLYENKIKSKGKTNSTEFYKEFKDIEFDSLTQGPLVFDKTLSNNSKEYEFDATELKKQEQGFYAAKIKALLNNKITIEQKAYFVLIDNATTSLKLNIEHFFIPCANTASPGESVNFIAGSALPDVYGLFVLTKGHQIIQRQWIHLTKNQQLIRFPIKEEYLGGINATFLSYANGHFYEQSHLIKVPFDNKELHISFNSFRKILYPGQQETWQLKIKDANGKSADAEMVATLYDQSLDEIRSNDFYYFPYSNFDEEEYYGRGWEFADCSTIKGCGVIENSRDIDIPPPPPPYGYGYNSFSSVNYFPIINWDLDKKKKGRAVLFYKPQIYMPKPCEKSPEINSDIVNYAALANTNAGMMPPPPPSASVVKFIAPVVVDEIGGNIKKSDANETGKALIRRNFHETALFYPHLRTDNQGLINVSFTMPDALTSWKMCGFAHTRDMKTGSITNEVVTRKEFMVMPNWPRFLRSGDTILFNARVENNVSKSISGDISLEILDAVTHKTISENIFRCSVNQKFLIKSNANSFVQWRLLVPYKTNALLFRVKAKSGSSSDGEEMVLPVLPNEVLVTETLPIVIHGNGEKSFLFKHLLSQDLKDVQNYKLVFELTPNPRWNVIKALPYLAEYPHECAEQTFNKYFAYCLAGYISKHNSSVNRFFNHPGKTASKDVMSNLESNPDLKSCLLEETPWMFDAKTESGSMQKLFKLFNSEIIEETQNDLLQKISGFQNEDGGIAWFKGMQSSNFISYYILEALGKINKIGELGNFEQGRPGFVKNLINYSDNTLVAWYLKELKRNSGMFYYMDQDFILSYAYARSYFIKEYPLEKQKLEAYNYLLKQIRSKWQKSYQYQKPMIALILFRSHDYVPCNQIIESLKERAIRNPESGMFWSFKQDTYDLYNQVENQALTLELFAETRQNQNDIKEIKNWLYLQKKNNQWHTTITTAKACYSLLLNEKNWTNNTASFKVDIGTRTFSINALNSSGNPAAALRENWDASQISNNMGNIKVTSSNNANTTTWGAVYWQYFQKMKNLKETASGIWIKKTYFVKHNNEYRLLGAKENVKVGDEIVVHLEFGTDRNVSYVHLKDLRPTCLEPVSKCSEYHYQNGMSYFESIRDASQNFFIEYLITGKHLIEYKARVTHHGHFQTGNATIRCMYAPECAGHSGSENLRVE